MSAMTNAYAAISPNDEIIVKTVCDTEIGAIVNLLVVTGIYTPRQGDGDFRIRDIFARQVAPRGFKVEQVTIYRVGTKN